jgi:hypothetical protein
MATLMPEARAIIMAALMPEAWAIIMAAKYI